MKQKTFSRLSLSAVAGAVFFCAGAAQAQDAGQNAGGQNVAGPTAGAKIADQKYPVGPSLGESEKIGAEYRLTGLLLTEKTPEVYGKDYDTIGKKKRDDRERRKKKKD